MFCVHGKTVYVTVNSLIEMFCVHGKTVHVTVNSLIPEIIFALFLFIHAMYVPFEKMCLLNERVSKVFHICCY